jgi:pSer/pThr/pTyr-binding forkhead associated (FHA) protein
VNDPLIAQFAHACGATAPLDLRVDLAGGGPLAEGSLDQPFTLIGRDDACDVTLTDPEVNLRHAWVQVLGGRAFAVDLGSRTGLQWPDGARGSGWLDVGTPVRVGPFLFRLRAGASDKPSRYPAGYNPLAADTGAKARPTVALEFRNGRRARDRWSVNRLLTLIGRAPDCKIHLTADDISPYHCGLVATRTGLWVIDLSGRGVVVNDERMRVAPLTHGAELWVGRFLIACRYQAPPAPGPAAVPPPPASANGRPAPGPARPAPPAPAPAAPPPDPVHPPGAEDEVELGAEPEFDELTASHIMADAFRQWPPSAGGPTSSPIQVSASGPKTSGGGAEPTDEAGDDASLVPLLAQMAELSARTATEFQQTLVLVAQLFSRARREHLTVLHNELSGIQELTEQIAAARGEVVRRTLEMAALECGQSPHADGAKATGPGAAPWASPSAKTPLPDPSAAPLPHHPADPPGPALARAAERLTALQQDRANRWRALIALFAVA